MAVYLDLSSMKVTKYMEPAKDLIGIGPQTSEWKNSRISRSSLFPSFGNGFLVIFP